MKTKTKRVSPKAPKEENVDQLELIRADLPGEAPPEEVQVDTLHRGESPARPGVRAGRTHRRSQGGATTSPDDPQRRGDVLRTTEEAARCLGIAPTTLHKWRVQGSHLPFVKFGGAKGSVRYRQRDLDLFIERSTRRSTSDPGSPAGGSKMPAPRRRRRSAS